jgi:hypothetical protein
MPKRKCFLCGGQFQLVSQAHLGTQVKPWDIIVCDGRRASQRAGSWPSIRT